MAWTLVASTSAELGPTGGTTSAINTTGANLLVILNSYSISSGPNTVSDSAGNTWSLGPSEEIAASGDGTLDIHYCLSPTTNASHTFSTIGKYSAMVVLAFSGSGGAIDVQNSNAPSGTFQSLPCGSITPTVNNELVIFGGVTDSTPTGNSVNLGTFAAVAGGNSGVSYGALGAYYEQTTAAAINPTFAWTSAAQAAAGASLTFKPAAVFAVSGADTIVVTDAGSAAMHPAVSGADTIVVTDAGSAAMHPAVSGADTITLTDAGSAAMHAAVAGADSFSITDAGAASIGTFAVAGADTIVVTDAGAATMHPAVSGTDTITLTDAGSAAMHAAVAGADSFSITDAGAASIGTFAVAGADTIVVTDAGAATMHPAVSGTDTITLTDAGSAAVGAFSVSGADTIVVTDAGSAAMHPAVVGADSLTLTDSAMAVAIAALSGSDAISLSDSATAAITSGINVSGADTITVVDRASAILVIGNILLRAPLIPDATTVMVKAEGVSYIVPAERTLKGL